MAASVRASTSGSGSSTTASANKPTNTAPGDVLIAFVHTNGPRTTVDANGSTPFTDALADRSYNGPSAQLDIYKRIAGNNEPASYSFTLSASDRWTCIIVAVSGADADKIFDVAPSATTENTGTGTDTATDALTTLTDGALILAVGCNDSNTVTFTATPGDSFTSQANVSGQQLMAVASKEMATAGTQASVSWTQSTSNGTWLTNIFSIAPNKFLVSNASWTLQHKIASDPDKVSGTANLTNFPSLLTEANFLSVAFSNSQGKEINSNYLLNDANLQAYYRFENNLNDSSSNAYHLSANGSSFPTYVDSVFGKGLDFEAGNSNYLNRTTTRTNLEIQGDLTYSAWYTPESQPSTSKDYWFISCWGTSYYYYGIYYSGADKKIYLAHRNVSSPTTKTLDLPIGVKTLFTVTRNHTTKTVKFYVNGVLFDTTTYTGDSNVTGSGGLEMGRANWNDHFIDGVLDDVAVFNRALTDAEAKALYTGGADLRFTTDTAGTTQIPHEVVNWDIVNSVAEVHVKIPTLSYNTATTIYVWSGNASAVPLARNDTYGSDNVWDSNYKLVLHGNTTLDSTVNSNNITPVNSPTINATGKFGGAFDLEKSNFQYFTLPNDTFATIDPITVSAWVKHESFVDLSPIFTLGASDNNWDYRICFQADSNSKMTWKFGEPNGTEHGLLGSNALSTATWYNFVGQIDYGDGQNTMKLYSNGSIYTTSVGWGTSAGLDTTPTSTTIAPRVGSLRAGGTETGNFGQNWCFDGIIDELRISNILRSADWIATEYNNQNDPSTFWIESLLQIDRSVTSTITLTDITNRQIDYNRNLIGNLTLTDSINVSKQIIRELSSNLTLIDLGATTSIIISIHLEDSLTLTDEVALTKQINRAINSDLTLSDILTSTVEYNRSQDSNITLSDSLTFTFVLNRELIDDIALTDTINRTIKIIGKSIASIESVERVKPIIDNIKNAKPEFYKIDKNKPIIYTIRKG